MPNDPRFRRVGDSPYPHEEEALQYLERLLPNHDPYRGWALLELPDPATGRLLEIDALVIGYGAIYLIEIKSHPGRITGDATDWWWHPPDDPTRKVWVDPPLRLANLKAKILKSRLAPHVRDVPWIQPLIFLGAEDAVPDMRADGRLAVVTRDGLRDALVKHQFPGVSPHWQNRRLSAPQVQAVVRALHDEIGVRERKGRALAGEYELGALIDEGPGYQDRKATHRANPKHKARARTYLVPLQTSVERRQQLRRAATRESDLLYEVREHQSVLSWLGYAADAPLGPTVLFDAFEGAEPLPAFLRGESPSFDERLEILTQLAHALAYCHRRAVFHGGLSPEAVLVRRRQSGVEARLTNFQLGQGQDIEATSHWSALASVPSFLYQAAELRAGAPPDERTDLYSLGSLAHYLFTDRPPADDLAELHQKLERDHALDARLVDPTLPKAVADAIDFATQSARTNRADDAEAWIQLLLEELTDPALDLPELDPDPLLAKRDDRLGDLTVLGVLGQGATARVLAVVRDEDERELALKVSLDPDHDPRLRAEAAALAKLRHPRIVQLHDERTIAGRTCLLLGLAGDTLKRHLQLEGSVSLDFASRYGDDLLGALEHLEDEKLIHRDIKPANLGVGTTGKTAHHLTLFDFSLADLPRTALGVGTSAYRDPFLPARGAWDPAADRWSAAVTLHEMLTGVRPSHGGALDPDARLTLAAERFDASVRGALVTFFERALHRDVEQRFTSAKEMRHAWFRAFEAPTSGLDQPDPALIDAPDPLDALTDDEVKSIAPDTPVMALPLSFRARNALDRSGLLVARDLLTLPDNRLSAVRGVGTRIAQEVLQLRERWVSLTGASPAGAEPFDPRYAGDDLRLGDLLGTTELDRAFAAALQDAGLQTLGAVARAPRVHIETLAARLDPDASPGASLEALSAILLRETDERARRGVARPIEALTGELLPKRTKRVAYVRALFGLGAPFEGRLDVSAREVAAHLGKSPRSIFQALGAMRDDWASHDDLADLESRVETLLERAGGVSPLARAADALLGLLPHDPEDPLARARAAALIRIVYEVQKEDVDGVRVVRLGRGQRWLLRSQRYTESLRRLGAIADELATREPLTSPADVQQKLESIARGGPLEGTGPALLVEYAAAASERAACSALLELYPRGLDAARALELSASHLVAAARPRGQKSPSDAGLTPSEVHQKVAARYPDAQALPDRPALDALLTPLRLEWRTDLGRYLRVEDRALGLSTTVDTRNIDSHTLVSSAPQALDLPPPRRARRPELSDAELAHLELERRLRIALEQRAFRVLAINPAFAAPASRVLERHLSAAAQPLAAQPLAAQPLDALLLRAMHAEVTAKRIRPDVVHRADREGPGGPGWPRLEALMALAEARVQAELLAQRGPLLLTRPGLLARYGLTTLLEALVARANADDPQATFLLVPASERGGVPRIDGRLTIPGILPTHVLRIPRTFVTASAEAA